MIEKRNKKHSLNDLFQEQLTTLLIRYAIRSMNSEYILLLVAICAKQMLTDVSF